MATRADFAAGILQSLGIVPGETNFDLLVAVQSFEDSDAANNPLDTTLPSVGATDYNSTGVKNYPSFKAGIAATVATLEEGRYTQFRDVLRGSDTTAMAMALANGGWAGTAPETVIGYTKDLEAMVATVRLDRERYYNVEVAESEAVPDAEVSEEDPKAPTATESSDAGTATEGGPTASSGASESAPETEETKDNSALHAEVSEVEADADEGKAEAVLAKIEEIETHLSELKELVK